MCQDEKVFAVATVTRKKAEIIFKNNPNPILGEVSSNDY